MALLPSTISYVVSTSQSWGRISHRDPRRASSDDHRQLGSRVLSSLTNKWRSNQLHLKVQSSAWQGSPGSGFLSSFACGMRVHPAIVYASERLARQATIHQCQSAQPTYKRSTT